MVSSAFRWRGSKGAARLEKPWEKTLVYPLRRFGEHTPSHAIMVPPARRLTVSLSLLLCCTVHRVGVENSPPTHMEASDGRSADRISDHSASGGKLLLPTFPGENPSELELKRWSDASKDRLRASKLLPFALAAAPTASSDYTERSLIPTPAHGTDASILNAVLGKNLGITADNIDRRTSWANRVRDLGWRLRVRPRRG